MAALARLGLAETVLAGGEPVLAVTGHTRSGRTVMDLRYGRWRPSAFGLGVQRAALFGALFTAMQAAGARLVTGFAAEATLETREGRWVEDGGGRRHGPFDLVVAADGAHSRLRAAVAKGGADRPYPWAALWIARPDTDGRWAGALRQVYDGAGRMMGVLPTGRGLGGERQAAVFWSLRADAYPAWRAAGLPAFQAQLHHHWPEAAALTAAVTNPDHYAFAAYRDVAVLRWTQSRLVLIGDAAHATSPQLGQGANLALVDAVTLADALATCGDDLEAALKAYCAARKPAVRWTQLVSRALTPVFQSRAGWIGWARDLAFQPLSTVAPVERLMLATLSGAAAFPGTRPLPAAALLAPP
jgi:2-polyprenyl-6-methoxyphenol hydroxylase-like FAD-dependent oxidoreductase